MIRRGLCFLILLLPLAAFGQDNAMKSAFDVASVKPSAPGSSGGGITPAPDGLTARNVTLLFCIRIAYDVQDYQISGPDWLTTEQYDIAAKTDTQVNQDQLRLMLRALLAERFKLALHREEKTRSAYELVVGANGPKLTEAKVDEKGGVTASIGHLAFTAAPMSALVRRLSQQLHEPVSDLTGLKGIYDFTLDWEQNDTVPGPSLFTAVQEQLGLKLEAKKVSIEALIVDHADRAPAAN
jgi:uncharacterized protein (TIGR03435 family)